MAESRSDPLIAGIRRLGEARVEFGRVAERLHAGEWVAAPGPAGEEPALVVIAPEQVLLSEAELPELPLRRLSEVERARLPELFELALRLARQAAAVIGELKEPLRFLGVRVTLDGSAIVEYWEKEGRLPAADIAARLSERLGRPVHLVASTGERPRALFGGPGRLGGEALDLVELARRRLGVLPGEVPPRPGGYPRLGSRVATPLGDGVVRSVSTRHRTVSVELEDGTRHDVPLDQVVPGVR